MTWEGSSLGQPASSYFSGPAPSSDWTAALTEAFQQPLEFPPLRQAVLPEDKIVIVLDRGVPGTSTVLAAVWEELARIGVSPQNVTLLHPASWSNTPPDPRQYLPAAVRSDVSWKIHDPTAAESTGYLASSLSGERVYLSRIALEADVVFPIGTLAFDPVLGYRSPAAAIFPGLSNTETIARSHALGHTELNPEDDRPWRQLVEEVSWLLGVQFGVVVIPSAAPNQPAEVFVGSLEAITRAARNKLSQYWKTSFPTRVETVVVSASSVDGNAATWEDVGRALATARQVVQRGGRIVLLTSLQAELGPGMQLVQAAGLPRDCAPHLKQLAPKDMVPATQWAQAADFAQLYTLSGLPGDQVEDLFCIPLESAAEVERLLAGCEDLALINQANQVWATIAAS